MTELPGKPASLWLETAAGPAFPRATGNVSADVAVVGAGITGVTLAHLLKRSGAKVVLLEAARVGSGVTGHTTAKLTSLHGLTYARLASRFGKDGARVYGEANEAGLAKVAELVDELGIDCDLRRKPAYTYTETVEDRDRIDAEVETAQELGLPASYSETTDLPFPIAGAVRFADQAEFHPQKYLLALAGGLPGGGSQVFEGTRALGLDDGRPCRLPTDGGATISAERVVVATHAPFLDRGLFFARTHPSRSYVLAAALREPPPEGMYLSTEKPAHSIRSHGRDGAELLLVGGEAHKAGQGDSSERYLRLAAYARERFGVERFEYRWSSQDNMPADGVPYVGRLWPFSQRVFVATGYRKWGLAQGTAAAMILADQLLDRPNPWGAFFSSMRLNASASAPELVKENADSAFRFFADRLRKRAGASGLAPGEGRVTRRGLGQAAVYRDEAGRIFTLSARCTHLGCIVSWNSAEKSWDCPCHGSRFDHEGKVLQGPAVRPLARLDGS